MNKQNQHSDDEQIIAPAQITLNVAPQNSASIQDQSAFWRRHLFLIFSLFLAVTVLLAVVFILPKKISGNPGNTQAPLLANDASDGEGAASASPLTTSKASNSAPNESPWQDAQFAKERRETQDILAIMLDRQSRLEKIRVELWALEEYEAAQQLAVEADRQYSQQDFLKSSQLYKQSLDKLDALLEKSEAVYDLALFDGNEAILAGNQLTAEQNFKLASQIKPQSPEASKGLARTAVLEQVLDKINLGKAAERNKQLREAQEHYQQALALDTQSEIAQENLSRINQSIIDEDFRKAMSEGFAAIANGNNNSAISAFKKALSIKPNAIDASKALSQAQNQATEINIQTHIENAAKHEAKEEWELAVSEYKLAEKLDKNVVEAKVGLIRAQTFANFDNKMKAILANPERLTSAKVHNEYQQFLDDAKKIKNPGKRLQQQTQQLEVELRYALEPVSVAFVSDNETEVTLYQIGNLGKFEATELSLQPGTYTIVGSRNGYRDVRENFVVSAKKDQPTTVTIRCTEKISKG